MDPATVPLHPRRPLRTVILGAAAGLAWLVLSAAAAGADDTATPTPPADVAGAVSVTHVTATVPAPDPSAPALAAPVPTATIEPGEGPSLTPGASLWATVPVLASSGEPPQVLPAKPAVPVSGPERNPTDKATAPPAPKPTGKATGAPVPKRDPAAPRHVRKPVTTPAPTSAPTRPGRKPSPAPDPVVTSPAPAPVSGKPVVNPGPSLPVAEPVTRPTAPVATPSPTATAPIPTPSPTATKPAKPATTDPLPAESPVKNAASSGKPAVPGQALLEAVIPAAPPPAPVAAPPHPVPAAEPHVRTDCKVTKGHLTALRERAPAPDVEVFGTPLYLAAPAPAARPKADGLQTGSAPPAGAIPNGTVPPAPARDDSPAPLPNGTGLPAPDALPAAPGSASGNTVASGGPGGGAAWLPSSYLVIPTAGADPIRGPLQHVHSAVAADPGSSPD